MGTGIGAGLNFNSIESNSRNYEKERVICPRASRWIEVTDGQVVKRFPMACKRIDCPVCGPGKIRRLVRDFGDAGEASFNRWRQVYPDRQDYHWWVKLITFTWGGAEHRIAGYGATGGRSDYSGKKTPQQAYQEMQDGFNRLMTSIRDEFPHMDYCRVVEPQRDGYPHFHVVFIGPDANKIGLLDRLKHFWSRYESMGSFLNARKIDHGPRAGIRYALKYLTKLQYGLDFLPKGHRVLTVSNGFRMMMDVRKENNFIMVRMGNFNASSGYGAEFVFARTVQEFGDLGSEQLRRNLRELIEFFDNVGKPEQLTLPC